MSRMHKQIAIIREAIRQDKSVESESSDVLQRIIEIVEHLIAYEQNDIIFAVELPMSVNVALNRVNSELRKGKI